jgi:hypothetical protein
MKPRLAAFSSPSFALISVLALVSLAALTATAFLASARLDRQATRSLGETARLEMACASASACTRQTLNVMCQKSWQILPTYWRGTNATDWTNELGYLLIGYPNAANVRWAYTCGFNPATHKKLDTTVFRIEGINTNPGSYLSEIGSFMATLTNGFVTNPTSTNTNCTLIPLLGGRTSPPVGWTYIYQNKKIANSTNTTNVPIARFSYYMEDLTGLIDAERMGGTNRTTGTNALEISLTNLTTNWSSSSILNAANYTQFINLTNRAKYFSPGMMLYAGGLSTNDLRYFAHGLLCWDSFPNTIPMGIAITNGSGYANANTTTRKVNLNSSANLNVTTIAGAINANLPGFTNRAGGFCLSAGGGAINAAAYTGTAYVQTLAANIKDYIDTDSDPTTDGTALSTNRIRPVYRGVDSYPFVNEINKRYLLSSTNAMTQGGTNGIAYTVLTTDYLELWNLSSQTSPAGTLQFVAIHGQPGTLGFQPISFANPLGASNSLGQVVNGITTNNLSVPAIPPNGFSILSCPTVTNLFFSPSTNPAVFSLTQEFTNSRYFVAWNGVYYDAALGGIRRNSGNLSLGTPANRANLPSFIYATSAGAFANPAVGDPRATIYLSQVQDFNAYVGNATFGGRNVRAGSVAANREYYEVSPSGWPDGGHNSPKGSSPTSDNQIPNSFAPINTNLPPGRILNTGSLSNICELGGVFDPMQWGVPSLGVWQGKWTNLSTSGVSNNAYGGGTTLRIGRAEHPRFAFTNLGGTSPVPNMGLSSVALLDIFSTSDSYDNGGRINLNTAPAPVLRALAGGVILTNDSGMKPSSTLTVPNTMTEAFVQGVMRYRATYPFLSPSQLAFIATDYGATNGANHWTNTWPTNAVFGNTNPTISLTNAPGNTLGTTASMGVSAWNDQASEEWFTKIYNLSTVQSWNYRTYVVAQLVNTNGLPTGPSMRKYYLMYVRYTGTFPSIAAGPYVSFESQY